MKHDPITDKNLVLNEYVRVTSMSEMGLPVVREDKNKHVDHYYRLLYSRRELMNESIAFELKRCELTLKNNEVKQLTGASDV